MHEESLFRDLRRALEELAAREQTSHIVRVRVWVGALSHLTEARLREAWPHIVGATAAQGSMLEVEVSSEVSDPRSTSVVLTSVDL